MNNHPLSPQDHEILISRIIVWILDDEVNKVDLRERIIAFCNIDLSENDITHFIFEAFDRINEQCKEQNDYESVVRLHLILYEEIYRYFKSINYAPGCNKVLERKERLLNLFKDGNRFSFKKRQLIVHDSTPKVEYDMTKLTPYERNELDELLKSITINE